MSLPRDLSAPPGRPDPRRAPWWTLVALGVVLAVPAPWSGLALGGLLLLPLGRATERWLARRRRQARLLAGGGIALGRDRAGRAVVLSDRQLSAHGIVLGASGAGKSTTLSRVLCDRIARGLPVVALDLKGSPAFAATLARAAASAGRPCVVWTLEGGAHWNPLAHGNPTELKDRLIVAERFTEPHYRRAAERYLQTVFAVLAARQPGRAPALSEVVALCEPRRLAAAARRLPQSLHERVTDHLAGLTPDQLSAVRGLGTRLAVVTESHAGPWLAPGAPGAPTLDVRAALRGETVAVFSLNSSSYGSLAAQLGTMAVQDLVSAAGARLAQPDAPSALVAIDEFSALGADQVLALFARGREAGVSVLLATQELTDLDRAARGLREQIIGNTAVKLIHRQDVPASAHAAAQLTGSERVWEETRQFGPGGGRGFGPRGSRRQVERLRIHPDAIAALPTGAAILITKVPQTEVRVVQVSPIGPAVTPLTEGRATGAPGLEGISGSTPERVRRSRGAPGIRRVPQMTDTPGMARESQSAPRPQIRAAPRQLDRQPRRSGASRFSWPPKSRSDDRDSRGLN